MDINLNLNPRKKEKKEKFIKKEVSVEENSSVDIIKICIGNINKKDKYKKLEKKNLDMPYNEFIRYSENMEELSKVLGLNFFDFDKEIPFTYEISNTDDKYLIENNLFVLENIETKHKYLLIHDFKQLDLLLLKDVKINDFAIASLKTMNLLLAQNNEIKATIDSEKGATDYMGELFTFSKVNKVSDIVFSLKEFQLYVKILLSNGWRFVSVLDRKQAEIIRSYLEVKSNVESGSKIYDSAFTHNEDEMRINFFITAHGYRATVRIFNNDFKHYATLKDIGYTQDVEDLISEISMSKNGMIILSAPTGNGKSTTQNILLSTLAKSGVECLSVEHPVEQSIKGIDQVDTSMYVSADEENKITSKIILKSFLRAKPDVINGGELRDEEDYQIGLEIALTGHLFFGSTHSLNVKSTITRLLKNNVKEEDIQTLLRGIVCQTLVRKLCDSCKLPDGKGGYKVSQVGCKHCRYGYENKRTPVVEVAKFHQFKEWNIKKESDYEKYISLKDNANLKYELGFIDAIHRDRLVDGNREPKIWEIIAPEYLEEEDKNAFSKK